MIGIWKAPSDTMPFVALIRADAAQGFPHWQRDIARIGLLYETGRLSWGRPADPPLASAALDGIMDRLGIACALVDAGRNLIYANHAASRWIRRQTALRIDDGRLTAARSDLRRRLELAVRAATADQPNKAQVVVLNGGCEGEPPQVASCLPLPGPQPHALIVFGETSRDSELADLLLNAFGLTCAERRLARSLLLGRALEQAADAAGIKISTARSYLKTIFAKTGVRRQGEFVAVFGALVPPIVEGPLL